MWSWREASLRRWLNPDLPFPWRVADDGSGRNGRRLDFYEARHAIHALPAALGWRRGDAVLMPAFHHGVETAALRAAGCEVIFYGVGADFALDLDDTARRLTPRTRALYVIHYFGRAQPMPRIMAWARARRLQVIEDCALSLFAQWEGKFAGSFADAAIFCLHKTFPVPHGGLLWLPFSAGPAQNLHAPPWSHTLTGFWRRSRGPARFARVAGRLRGWRPAAWPEFAMTGLNDFVAARAGWRASAWVRGAVRAQNWRAIVAQRLQNYEILRRELECHGWPDPLPALRAGDVPLFFLLRVPEKPEFCRRLWRAGIMAVRTWAEGPEGNEFKASRALRRTLIELPIHQGIGREALSYMAKTACAVRDELECRVPSMMEVEK